MGTNILTAESLEVPKPSCWPTPMARFGTVPRGSFKGEPIYRVVFAPTCRKLIFGTDAQGNEGAHSRPAYRHLGNRWILEKWLDGWALTKMTPKEYRNYGPRDPQSGMLIEGPYPHDGAYNHCWTFDSIEDISGVDKIIALIEHGAKRSFAELQAQNRELDEKEEKAAQEKRFLRVRETEPLYGVRPANFAGAPKAVNHKSQREGVSANSLGLPTRRGSVVAMKGPTIHGSI